MAASGTIWGSFSGISDTKVRPYMTYEEYDLDASLNKSKVSVKLYFTLVNTAYYGFGTASSLSTTVSSTVVNHSNHAFGLSSSSGVTTELIASSTWTITHNSNGSFSATLSSAGSTNIPWGSFNFSGTMTLTTLTRATAVTSTAASSVGGTSATVGGTVTDAGLPPCSDRGVYWGTSSGSQPTKITSGSGAGAFTANITGLARGTTYYFKAYSYNTSYGYRYGSVLNFTTTAAAPSVTTGSASLVDVSTATVSGTVTDDNGASVTARGICYNTTGSPTTSDSTEASGTGEGAFSGDLTGLTPDTTYYAKAYATNSEGTSYGVEVSFTTLTAEPVVTTTPGATGVTSSTATVAGNVTSDSGSTITERGFVYGASENPTTSDSKAITTGTTGAMSKELTSLTPGTLRHFRAFATNSEGTGYGDDSTFTTLPVVPTSLVATVADKDQIDLTWVKGLGGTYTIVRRGTTPPANINSGDLVYQGTGTSISDTGLDAGTLYYYRAWSATTSDWSVAYSSTYASDSETTKYDFEDPENAFVDDSNYATVPTTDGKLYAQVSKDGGTTWSMSKELTFTGTITAQDFGLGITELWGKSWVGSDLDDGSFAVKLTGGSNGTSYQTYKTFGFTITDTAVLTGVRVRVNAAYDGSDILLYYVMADGYYGTSPLPVGEGSLVYDSTLDRPTFYDGTDWQPMASVEYVDAMSTGNSLQIDCSGGVSDSYGVLSGVVNGSNTRFTVSLGSYVSGSLKVYLNGQLQTQGSSEDWVETTPGSGTFDFATAPTTGDVIIANYQFVTSATGNADTLDSYHASHFASLTGTETLTNKTLSTGSEIDENVDIVEVLKQVYPVGVLYITTISTNPNTIFGFGTWVAFGEGKVLVGKASSGTFSTAGATMGSETHTHSLTSGYAKVGMVADNNSTVVYDRTATTFASDAYTNSGTAGEGHYSTVAGNGYASALGGNSGSGNSIQPSIVVYMWKRTA